MSNFFGTAFTGSNSTVVYDGPVYEGYNVNHGGEFAIATESAEQNLNILAAIAALDVQMTQAVAESMNGVEDYQVEELEVALEAAGAGVIEKIKNAIKTLWGKVKAFFASVVRTLDGLTKSTEDFVKKYKSQLEKLNLSGFKYEMHNYTIESLDIEYSSNIVQDAQSVVDVITKAVGSQGGYNATADATLETIDKRISEMRDERDNKLEAFRGAILNQSGKKFTAEEFREEVYKKLRSGKESNEVEEVSVNVHKIMTEVKETSKLKSKISKAQKEADKTFGDAIKLVDKLALAINKGSSDTSGKTKVDYKNSAGADKTIGGKHGMSTQVASRAATVANHISSMLSAQQAIVNTAFSEWNSAVKERDAVYKKVLVKAFSYKQKD